MESQNKKKSKLKNRKTEEIFRSKKKPTLREFKWMIDSDNKEYLIQIILNGCSMKRGKQMERIIY